MRLVSMGKSLTKFGAGKTCFKFDNANSDNLEWLLSQYHFDFIMTDSQGNDLFSFELPEKLLVTLSYNETEQTAEITKIIA